MMFEYFKDILANEVDLVFFLSILCVAVIIAAIIIASKLLDFSKNKEYKKVLNNVKIESLTNDPERDNKPKKSGVVTIRKNEVEEPITKEEAIVKETISSENEEPTEEIIEKVVKDPSIVEEDVIEEVVYVDEDGNVIENISNEEVVEEIVYVDEFGNVIDDASNYEVIEEPTVEEIAEGVIEEPTVEEIAEEVIEEPAYEDVTEEVNYKAQQVEYVQYVEDKLTGEYVQYNEASLDETEELDDEVPQIDSVEEVVENVPTPTKKKGPVKVDVAAYTQALKDAAKKAAQEKRAAAKKSTSTTSKKTTTGSKSTSTSAKKSTPSTRKSTSSPTTRKTTTKSSNE